MSATFFKAGTQALIPATATMAIETDGIHIVERKNQIWLLHIINSLDSWVLLRKCRNISQIESQYASAAV